MAGVLAHLADAAATADRQAKIYTSQLLATLVRARTALKLTFEHLSSSGQAVFVAKFCSESCTCLPLSGSNVGCTRWTATL